MKTICNFLIAAAAVFFLNINADAQSALGMRGGFSMYTLKNMPVEGQENVEPKVVFGNYSNVYYEIGLSKFFALQPEVNYIQKGGKVTAEGENDFSLRVRLDYLEVPVLAKFRLGSGGFRGYLTAGPSVGYALNGRSKIELGNFSEEEKIKFDDDFGLDGRKDNRFDISAVAGGGIQQKFGPGSFVLDARLAYDFNDYSKFDGDAPAGHKKARWEGLAVSFGYQVNLGGK